MKNKQLNQKETADFFGTNLPIVSPTVKFEETLGEKVLQKYINSYGNDEMENNTKKSFWPKVALLGIAPLVVVGAFVATWFVTNNNSNTPNTIAAEVVYADGTVEYKTADSGWYVANVNQELNEGDSVRVLGKGRAIINLDDGSAIRLDNDSEVEFDSMDPNDIVIENVTGEVYSRVAKADRDFTVNFDKYSFNSLGTAYITVNLSDKKGVEVYESKVAIEGLENEIIVDEGEKYYFENAEDKETENKVTALTQEEIQNKEFVQWNKTQDEANPEYKAHLGVLNQEKTQEQTQLQATLELGVTQTETGLMFTWTVQGDESPKGFKLVKSKSENPEFGKDEATYIDNPEARQYELKLQDGQIYNFRICQYTGDSCVNYSPNVQVGAPAPKQEQNQNQGSETTEIQAYMSLGGHADGNGINLNWEAHNLDVSNGYKIMYSTTNPNPTFGVDDYKYISNPSQTSVQIPFKDGKTYYFRVCRYTGGACDNYSNAMTITAPGNKPVEQQPVSGVNSISVTANGSSVSWTVDGYSKNGFKVVWSKVAGPTYPTRSTDKYQYFSDPSRLYSDALDSFDGSGTYYVRVCEYLGGACGVYSNQVTVNL